MREASYKNQTARSFSTKGLPAGPLYYRLTDPKTAAQGTMLGSVHVVSLKAALEQLPAAGRASIESSKYVVIESTTTTWGRLWGGGKTADRQLYWQQSPKKAEAFLRFLKWAGARNPEAYLSLSPEELENLSFEYSHRNLFAAIRAVLPPHQAGAMDSEIATRCKAQGGAVYALDDLKSLRDGLPGGVSSSFSHQHMYKNIVLAKFFTELYPKRHRRTIMKTSKPTSQGFFSGLWMRWKWRGDLKSIAKRIQPQCRRVNAVMKDFHWKSDLAKPGELAAQLAVRQPAQWFVNAYLGGNGLDLGGGLAKLINRDHHWHQKMVDHIQTKKSPFFMFGAAHLSNVLSRFRAQGYKVEYMTRDGAWALHPTQ